MAVKELPVIVTVQSVIHGGPASDAKLTNDNANANASFFICLSFFVVNDEGPSFAKLLHVLIFTDRRSLPLVCECFERVLPFHLVLGSRMVFLT